MVFQQGILGISDLVNFLDLSTFTHNIPIEWVESRAPGLAYYNLLVRSGLTEARKHHGVDFILWSGDEKINFAHCITEDF